ncbi:ORC-CDC6 family AAA ATPase [Paenibacillus glucanolyticus]|uniref:ORC-CDC6 family AAA ATPase n=1 Tax=Paenibacillus glucanolyticus TaxID=59843 RepID=UPI00096F8A40|nr:hypothetical protein [Paenibacillus glucanolyticus]OMF72037.1 hypothetical protein BK142_21365 [Paenibacillus glucanolyticus]
MESKVIFATRAEELGNRVFDYFVMPAESFYSRLLKQKAAVLVGGRGTGKTMLLKSLAFEYVVNGKSVNEAQRVWEDTNYLGCYIRADTNIVSSFRGRGIDDEDWANLYAHYFNLRVVQQMVKTLRILIKLDVVPKESLEYFISRYFEIFEGDEFITLTFESLEKDIKFRLDELVRYINNPTKFPCPLLSNNGTLIFECCTALMENSLFQNKVWFVLIDEYENMSEQQQRIVNTLIKANQPPVIFKIAMRPGGWWTQQTLALSENLEEIADFDMVNYQTVFSNEDYSSLIIEAFNKSLALNNITDSKFLNIKNLLPDLAPEEEALQVERDSKRKSEYIDRIREYINRASAVIDKNELEKSLIIKDNPLKTRFNLVLLDRGKSPEDIVKLITLSPKKYNEAYQHSKIGTLFLFCSEFRTKKTYAGFETYVLLSSKIMRNFVSLFSRAWELSLDEGFSVSNPRPINYEIQSRAAYDVSQGKVFEIVSYPSGPALTSFANQLGRIFEQLNKDPRQSQPERNHFSIIGDTSDQSRNLMRTALMYSILQEIPATKLRSEVEGRGRDYFFNRIYSPFYNISYRKMHKLELKSIDFEALMIGNDEDRKQVASKLLKRYLKTNEVPDEIIQMDLFDPMT